VKLINPYISKKLSVLKHTCLFSMPLLAASNKMAYISTSSIRWPCSLTCYSIDPNLLMKHSCRFVVRRVAPSFWNTGFTVWMLNREVPAEISNTPTSSTCRLPCTLRLLSRILQYFLGTLQQWCSHSPLKFWRLVGCYPDPLFPSKIVLPYLSYSFCLWCATCYEKYEIIFILPCIIRSISSNYLQGHSVHRIINLQGNYAVRRSGWRHPWCVKLINAYISRKRLRNAYSCASEVRFMIRA